MAAAVSDIVRIERNAPVTVTIGVLAVQGNYDIHARAFERIGARVVFVRKPEELAALDGLVLPGGESTTMLKFLEANNFFDALHAFASSTPCFATCAGAILLAQKVTSPSQRSLGLLKVTMERNAYGRQIDSVILTEQTSLMGDPLEMVFIRAPRITELADGVEVLARRDGQPVLVRQGHLLVATFHPEMTADTRVQKLFLEIVEAHSSKVKEAVGVFPLPVAVH